MKLSTAFELDVNLEEYLLNGERYKGVLDGENPLVSFLVSIINNMSCCPDEGFLRDIVYDNVKVPSCISEEVKKNEKGLRTGFAELVVNDMMYECYASMDPLTIRNLLRLHTGNRDFVLVKLGRGCFRFYYIDSLGSVKNFKFRLFMQPDSYGDEDALFYRINIMGNTLEIEECPNYDCELVMY